MSKVQGQQVVFELEHDDQGRLVLTDEAGVRHVAAQAVRNFPISDPDHWISICDLAGRELVTIADPESLGAGVRTALASDLARREFVPVIRRVLQMPADAEPTVWQVETDRGPTEFTLKSRDDVRRLDATRALIVDTQGARYRIENIASLDALSRRALERFL
jgi:hypothetical protein